MSLPIAPLPSVAGPVAESPSGVATVVVDGSALSLAEVEAVARGGAPVRLAPAARVRMAATREVVEEALASGQPVYGLTTGVAERKRILLAPDRRTSFSHRLVEAHRVAQGEPAPPEVVRATMLALANTLAKGAAGVRPELVELILLALDRGTVPAVRRLGSVGQADLGPLADLAHGFLEQTRFELAANEGLALLDNNAFAVAWAALALLDAERLLASLDVAAALDLEAFGANLTMVHPVVAETRSFEGLRRTLHHLRSLLEGSALFAEGAARNLQDPLTFRCIPQIHGAARDALAYARAVVETELNSSQGNPVVVLAERRILSVGNFDLAPTAAALDFVRIALAPAVNAAAERTVKLLQSPLSGLAPGLAVDPEVGGDGLAELAVAAQAIAIEARTLAHPVSYELVSTSKGEGLEDRATMAPLAARRLSEMVSLSARVGAIELMVAAQAVELRGVDRLGVGTRRAWDAVRRLTPFVGAGDGLPADLDPIVELCSSGAISVAAASVRALVDNS